MIQGSLTAMDVCVGVKVRGGVHYVQGYTTCRQSEGVRAGVQYVQTIRGGTCRGTLRADSQRGYVQGYTTCRQSEGVHAGVHDVQTVRGGTCRGTLRADSQRGFMRGYSVWLKIGEKHKAMSNE